MLEDADELARYAAMVELATVREIFAAAATSELGRARALSAGPMATPEEARLELELAGEARALVRREMRVPLQGIGDGAALVAAATLNGRPLEGEELAVVARAARCGENLREALAGLDRGGYPRLRALGDGLPALQDLELAIVSAIDERAKVRSTASARLSRLRDEIEELKQRLDARIERIADSAGVRAFLQSPKATLRNGRYVLPVKANHRHEIEGILHDRSQTGGTVYVEPQELVSLGNELADRVFEERDEVTRILWELTQHCTRRRADLERLTEVLGRVDYALARGRVAVEYDMRVPALAEAGPFTLVDARHPLLLRMKREGRFAGDVVPVSLELGGRAEGGGEGADILIVTGPNTGGKTVALKTAGLLALMARCGLPIPAAEGTRIPFFTRFFADIGDEQGIEQSLSTFSAHVRMIVKILARADARSLVLIDELGAGTDPEEGAAIGSAVLERLLAIGARAIVTTHLLSLKGFAFSRARVENASVEFDVETLRPTYRLAIGVPGSSHAMTIARRHGMPEDVVTRAEEIRSLGKGTGEARLLDEVERLRFEAARNRDATAETRRAAETERAEVAREREALLREGRTLGREADQAAEALYERLRAAIREASGLVRPLPKAAAEWVEAVESLLAEVLRHTPFAERRRAFAHSLGKGKRVYLIRFEREGVVTRINKEKEKLTVLIGGVSVDATFDDVTWVRGDAPGHRVS